MATKIESEKLLEAKLREAIRKLNGYAIKFFAPSFTGLPDRIILLPGARIYFVEVKTTGKKPTPRQLIVHGLLRGLGFEVYVVDCTEDLNNFLNILK